MSVVYEQSRLTYGTGDTVALAFLSNVKAKSFLWVVITQWQSGGITSDSLVSDSQGNQYAKIGNRIDLASGMCLEEFYAVAGSAAANTVTVNAESTSTSVAIHEFSTSTNASILIDTQDQNTGSDANANGGPVTPSNNNCVIIGAVTTNQTGLAANEVINPIWASGTSYDSTSVVEYNSKLYVGLQDSINIQPDLFPAYWQGHGFPLQEYEDGDNFSVVNTHYNNLTGTSSVSRKWKLAQAWGWGAWAVVLTEESVTIKSLTDTGAGADQNPQISASLSRSDVGTGVDNPQLAASLNIADGALGGDFIDLSALLTEIDTGTGSDEVVVSVVIVGSTVWGQVTGVEETNIRTFATNWTGTGQAEGSGDDEKLRLCEGDYMISEVVETGVIETTLLQNNYAAGDTVLLQYRTGATEAACLSAGWNTYTVPFESLGYVQIRVEYSL